MAPFLDLTRRLHLIRIICRAVNFGLTSSRFVGLKPVQPSFEAYHTTFFIYIYISSNLGRCRCACVSILTFTVMQIMGQLATSLLDWIQSSCDRGCSHCLIVGNWLQYRETRLEKITGNITKKWIWTLDFNPSINVKTKISNK